MNGSVKLNSVAILAALTSVGGFDIYDHLPRVKRSHEGGLEGFKAFRKRVCGTLRNPETKYVDSALAFHGRYRGVSQHIEIDSLSEAFRTKGFFDLVPAHRLEELFFDAGVLEQWRISASYHD